jgi:hypothetical protein
MSPSPFQGEGWGEGQGPECIARAPLTLPSPRRGEGFALLTQEWSVLVVREHPAAVFFL